MLWIPPGFAHGFVVLSEDAEFLYKTTDYWYPEHERTLLWNDPALRIDWPLAGAPDARRQGRRGPAAGRRGRLRLDAPRMASDDPADRRAADRSASSSREACATHGDVIALDRAALDLADADAIVAAVREVRPRLIVNAGAYTAVDRPRRERDAAFAVNARAPGILAEEAKRTTRC